MLNYKAMHFIRLVEDVVEKLYLKIIYVAMKLNGIVWRMRSGIAWGMRSDGNRSHRNHSLLQLNRKPVTR